MCFLTWPLNTLLKEKGKPIAAYPKTSTKLFMESESVIMISTYFQPQIIEKNIRSKDGRLLRVRVAVAQIDGRTYGRILGVELVGEITCNIKHITCNTRRVGLLPIYIYTGNQPLGQNTFKTKIASPYFHSLEFFISQMPRAPSIAPACRRGKD